MKFIQIEPMSYVSPMLVSLKVPVVVVWWDDETETVRRYKRF